MPILHRLHLPLLRRGIHYHLHQWNYTFVILSGDSIISTTRGPLADKQTRRDPCQPGTGFGRATFDKGGAKRP